MASSWKFRALFLLPVPFTGAVSLPIGGDMKEEWHIYVICTEEGRGSLFGRETPAASLARSDEQVKPSCRYCSSYAHCRTLQRWQSFRLLAWIAWSQLVARIRGCTSSYIELEKGQQPRYTGANSRQLAEEGTVLTIAWREHYCGSSRNAQEYFFWNRILQCAVRDKLDLRPCNREMQSWRFVKWYELFSLSRSL